MEPAAGAELCRHLAGPCDRVFDLAVVCLSRLSGSVLRGRPGNAKSRSRWEAAPRRPDVVRPPYVVEVTSCMAGFSPACATWNRAARVAIGAPSHPHTKSTFVGDCSDMIVSVYELRSRAGTQLHERAKSSCARHTTPAAPPESGRCRRPHRVTDACSPGSIAREERTVLGDEPLDPAELRPLGHGPPGRSMAPPARRMEQFDRCVEQHRLRVPRTDPAFPAGTAVAAGIPRCLEDAHGYLPGMERHRTLAAIVAAIVVVAVAVLVVDAFLTPRPTRIALYGDSLSMQSAQDFQFLAVESGKTTLLGGYGGIAPCDVLPRLDGDATSWHPDVAVLEFVGDDLTPCMRGYAAGTPAYYAKYPAGHHDGRPPAAQPRGIGGPDRRAARQRPGGQPERRTAQRHVQGGRLLDIGSALRGRRLVRPGERAVHLDPALPLFRAPVHRALGHERRPLPRRPALLPQRRHLDPGSIRRVFRVFVGGLPIRLGHAACGRQRLTRATERQAEAASSRDLSSPLSTLPVGLRGRASTKMNCRGTL